MKKTILKSLIVGLLVLSLFGMTGCDSDDGDDNGKVVAAEYRGVYIPDNPTYDDNAIKSMELTNNKRKITRNNGTFIEHTAWTIGNALWTSGTGPGGTDSEQGIFENNKFLSFGDSNRTYTKQ